MNLRFGAVVLLVVAGCADADRFALDESALTLADLGAEESGAIEDALIAAFGTPEMPIAPAAAARLLDADAIEQASGPVESHTPGVTRGLYRRHCARCHGVTGDGRGPTALYQAPYPRDFRRGVFKWKSTFRDAKPTAADLDRVIKHGVAGAAMPAFALLQEGERDALRQYVVYLSLRGELERALIDYAANEAPLDEPLSLPADLVTELLTPIVASWEEADGRIVETSASVESADEASLAAGRELFHSERAGCAKCHGEDGVGGAARLPGYEPDYDDWTRERLAAGIPRDLPVREAIARPLVGSTPHGGAQPADLFRRLHQGIAGTPMPAVGGLSADTDGGLTDAEIGQLVAYVNSLMRSANHEGTK